MNYSGIYMSFVLCHRHIFVQIMLMLPLYFNVTWQHVFQMRYNFGIYIERENRQMWVVLGTYIHDQVNNVLWNAFMNSNSRPVILTYGTLDIYCIRSSSYPNTPHLRINKSINWLIDHYVTDVWLLDASIAPQWMLANTTIDNGI